jgi:hypothetical protein
MGHIEGHVQHQELLFPEVLGVLTYNNLKRVINILESTSQTTMSPLRMENLINQQAGDP